MNVFAYRMPRTSQDDIVIMEVGVPSELNFSETMGGFVGASFIPTRKPLFYPQRHKLSVIPENVVFGNARGFEFYEKSESEYEEYINTIKYCLRGREDYKVVASRRFIIKRTLSISKFFHSLCLEYPDAFVFLVSTSEFGTWIGASPELLLQREKEIIKTVALAGTRNVTEHDEAWDTKNILEQKIVTEHILEVMKRNGLKPIVDGTHTCKAGKIEHLITNIECHLKAETCLLPILQELSPTPALCGEPRNLALDLIRQNEGDRHLYGGYCGPMSQNGDFRFNVVLRCANIEPGKITLFAGGGVTAYSDPHAEWEETEAKFNTILSLL